MITTQSSDSLHPKEPYILWDDRQTLPTVEQPDAWDRISDIQYQMIKKREPEIDGYNFVHGVAIILYKNKMFATWGANKGAENTVGEEALFCVSHDLGKSWSAVKTIGAPTMDVGRSHGVFIESQQRLWAFIPVFFKEGEGNFKGLSMELFVLNEQTESWENQGIVAHGFWPLLEPVRMQNGNWFVSGCDQHWRAVVAISDGDNFHHWQVTKIPMGGKHYTEASAWIEGDTITTVLRNQEPLDELNICAAVSVSRDGGKTWSTAVESNLPMNTCKPYCGMLSTGQRYMIGHSIQGANRARDALTIAVSRPGEPILNKVYLIRDKQIPDKLKSNYSVPFTRSFAYPHAIEHQGYLYIVYSAMHAQQGEGRMYWNINDLEMAIIPISSLHANEQTIGSAQSV
jgi:hypothetical protein